MSLSSFLLGSGKSKASALATIDNELDTLFQSTKIVPPPHVLRHPSTATSEKKRKALATLYEDTEPKQSEVKRKKSTKEGDEVKSSKDETLKGEKPKEKGGRTKKEKGERRAKKVRLDDSEDEDKDENDPGLEDAYAKGRVAKLAGRDKESQVKKARATTVKGVEDGVKVDVKMKGSDADGSSGSEVEEDDEEDASRLVHESLSGSKSQKDRRGKRTKKGKYAPPEETAELRNERTIFVGNVAVEVAKSKSALKSFKRHILSNLPTSISSTAKIESTRIRSVAFSLPTSKLDPTTSETTSDPSKAPSSDVASKLNHEKARVASWRASHSTKDDEDNDNEKKSKLSSQEKKRVAFIKKDIHYGADSVHVYVVFAHSRPQPTPSADHSEEKTLDTTAITTQTRTMSPYEVAALAVQHCNATVFMERTIRVDCVSTTSTAAANSASSSNAVAAKRNGTDGVGADPKKTIRGQP